MTENDRRIVVSNRKARYDYEILDAFEAGIVLTGTEVKSLRAGNANLQDSYALIDRGEVWLHGMHISPYERGSYLNHDPVRVRKLLVSRKEIRKLIVRVKEKGLTLVPLGLYFKGPYAKLQLGIARGKKSYDKRESIKKKDADREIAQKLRRRDL